MSAFETPVVTDDIRHGKSADEVLAVDELCAKFRKHFVLLDKCRFSDQLELTHGRVLKSSAQRDEVYRSLHEHPNSVVVFTGAIDTEVEDPILVELG